MQIKEKQVYYLFIVSTNGGLIYDKKFSSIPLDKRERMNSDAMMSIASSLHTIHDLCSLITPPSLQKLDKSSETMIPKKVKLETVISDTFRLSCFETLTGLKFIIITSLQSPDCRPLLKQMYELYADYVSKDPYHPADQPIKNATFERLVTALFTD
eukprot:TRINITY_DN2376_c0_g1_i4.p1 TRINITY_DN2376_c0_g1~~TRINITY_DN2376_c0_g1_i4.p1  ORF type:complete len:156 (-),score=34.51 TRINITY_DN2376_c0_g1_i4:154-621(-)